MRKPLEETRFLPNEEAAGRSPGIQYVPPPFVAHILCVPVCLIQQALDAARMQFAARFGKLPPVLAVLAFRCAEQSD